MDQRIHSTQQSSQRHRSDSIEQKLIGARVQVQNMSKSFGPVIAVDNASFDIAPGEFVSLLGPSGSGKTTILMNIAGFLAPSGGQVLVAGEDVLPLPAHRRNIGMVFQKYALFPHMTAAQNIAFPLQMRRWSKDRQRQAVRDVLETVQMAHLSDRLPTELSGGQQQRVALARAIVFEPPLLLMDEPLGALDKKLREELQFELKALQKRLGITVLFVTHDQHEAMSMSDRIAVMNEGAIEQIGQPTALYRAPRTLFVADFMGDSNFFSGTVRNIDRQGLYIRFEQDGLSFSARANEKDLDQFQIGERATAMVRPESIELVAELAHAEQQYETLPGTVRLSQFSGSHATLAIECQGQSIHVLKPALPGTPPVVIEAGRQVGLRWVANEAVAFPSNQGTGSD